MLDTIYHENPSLKIYHEILKDCDNLYLQKLLQNIQIQKNKKYIQEKSDNTYMLEFDYDDY